MGLGPAGRIIKKGADAVNGFGGKVLALFGRLQDMLPGRQIMQIDAEVFHGCLGAGKDAVKKDHEYIGDCCAGGPERLNKGDLRAAVGGQILDQQYPLAVVEVAFDLGVAAKPLRLLSHI